MVKCFMCDGAHHISKCKKSLSDLHELLLKKLIIEKKCIISSRQLSDPVRAIQIISALSVRQMKGLLKIDVFTPVKHLRKKLYEKYDTLSNNLFRFHVDYPYYEQVLSQPTELPDDQEQIRKDLERQFTYLLFQLNYLDSRDFIYFVRNLPDYFQRFVNERVNYYYPIGEPTTPPYSPPPSLPITMNFSVSVVENQNEYECAICQELRLPITKVTFNCNHYYCFECVENYIRHVNNIPRCPLCRSDVSSMNFFDEQNEKKIKLLLNIN